MTLTILPRSAWGARPSEGSVALDPDEVIGEAIHWPGMSSRIDATGAAGYNRVAAALRGWQNYHMDVRGWSDIAYMIAVDQVGRAWTGRGITIRSAANGDAITNRRYGAFLLIVGPGERPTTEAILTMRQVITEFRRHMPHAAAKPVGHGDIRPGGTPDQPSTDCPGPITEGLIRAGAFTPIYGTPPDEELDVDEATLRAIIADELNKQDRDLWILGTGKSQVIDPIKRLEADVDAIKAKLALS